MIIDVDPVWQSWLVDAIPEARCFDGWRGLIVEFGAVMRAGSELQVLEIKEKFGGLRIYMGTRGTNSDQKDELFEIKHAGERQSFAICDRQDRDQNEIRHRLPVSWAARLRSRRRLRAAALVEVNDLSLLRDHV